MKRLLRIISFSLAFIGRTYAGDLFNVSLNFCNTSENTLQYQIDPLVEKDICYTLSNDAQNPVTVKISFMDGTFTNDRFRNKACLTDSDTETFGRYVTDYEQLVMLNPGEAIQKKATLLYPQGMDGIYHGCITYSIVEDNAQLENTNMTVVMRRAKFIDVTVGTPPKTEEAVQPETDTSTTQETPINNIIDMTKYVAIIGIVLVLCVIVLWLKNMKKKKKAVHHHAKHIHKKK